MSDPMDKESEVVERLQRFHPRPSQQAYERMAEMPWNQPIERHKNMNIDTRRLSFSRTARTALAVLIVMVAAGVVVMMTPSLRTLAQDFLDSLFNRESTNTLTVPSSESGGETQIQYIDVAAAESQAGYPVKQPAFVPAGYSFAGALYGEGRHVVTLTYQRPGAEMNISQQPAEYAEFGMLTDASSGIGADAPIEQVQIGDVAGEYVAGAWIMTSETEAVWNAAVPIQRLRWQIGGMIYEVFVGGGSSDTGSGISKDDMVAIAASMQ